MFHMLETIANCSRKLFFRQNISSTNSTSKTEEKGGNIMEHLPKEIQLKIFANLSFDDLFTFKQTNRHFYDFINEYEGTLAHKKFNMLCFTTEFLIKKKLSSCSNEGRLFKKEIRAVDFPLTKQLQQKWQSALNKHISVFLLNIPELVLTGDTTGMLKNNNIVEPLLVLSQDDTQDSNFHLKLPLHPQNIEEMKIVRYWLKQIFNCVFQVIEFKYFVFNPEVIKLFFDDDEIAKLKLKCKKASICFNHQNNYIWKFNFDLLVISDLKINCENVLLTKEETNILFELCLTKGDKIGTVAFDKLGVNQIEFYNNLTFLIQTTRDLTKMVLSVIFKNCEDWSSSKLIVRGVETEPSTDKNKFYVYLNLYDQKIWFMDYWRLKEDVGNDLIESIQIIKMNKLISQR